MNAFHHIRAGFAFSLVVVNTIIMVIPLYLFVLLKLLLPAESIRIALSRILVIIAESWISVNSLIIRFISRPLFVIEGLDDLHRNHWYLVTSNHQSWSDILILQKLFNRKIPFLKFFLKQELIKVPLMGIAWWALDFPFMKRFTREELEKNPSLKGKDLETTQKACEKFQHFPTSVMNFFEGTRFTQAKHDKQASPYKYLLKPKAGGAAFVLGAMGGTLRSLLDVTIIYPSNTPKTLMAFLGGTVKEVRIIVRHIQIPEWASKGNYELDTEYRKQIQEWISTVWHEKDALIAENTFS